MSSPKFDISGKAKQTPVKIRAHAEARNSLAKIIIAGIVLGTLTIAYIVALFNEMPEANGILGLLGTGLGFLLGGRDRESNSN